MLEAPQLGLPVFSDLPVEGDDTAHLTPDGKKKGAGGPAKTTPEQREQMKKNKGKRGPARRGAHLDRVDIGG